MEDKVLGMLMSTMEKLKIKFDEAIEQNSEFEVAAYSEQITKTASVVLEHVRAKYEAEDINKLMTKNGRGSNGTTPTQGVERNTETEAIE